MSNGTTSAVTILASPTSGSIAPGYAYSSSDVLTNFFRGVEMGFAVLLAMMTLFVYPLFPTRTVAHSLLISVLVMAAEVVYCVYDVFLLPDCHARVKTIFTLVSLSAISYAAFQAELTYKVTLAHSKSKALPGSRYIIIIAFLLRVASSITVVVNFSWNRNLNKVCSSVLPSAINVMDKCVEIGYSLLLTLVFLYHLFRGHKGIHEHTPLSSGVAPMTPRTMAGTSFQRSPSYLTNHTRSEREHMTTTPAVVTLVQGASFLKTIMVNQGFLLLVTLMVETIYLILAITSDNSTLVGLWNAIFGTDYMFFMALHLLSSVVRRVAESLRSGLSHQGSGIGSRV
ncbi:hypothetical protein BC830DRAFT_1130966 [Chytriomyces sp. MP71]|nr:hypothetical protein BC830DRAFT_1130966 [Chytriomyces sp. MP71]